MIARYDSLCLFSQWSPIFNKCYGINVGDKIVYEGRGRRSYHRQCMEIARFKCGNDAVDEILKE